MGSALNPVEFPPLRLAAGDGDPRARLLVDAAYELLDEAGLEGLTIRAVLARTGLARRAFYDNFSGKDDLMLAVFEQTIRLAADHYRMMAEALPGPMARLAMIVTSIALGSADVAAMAGADLAAVHRRSTAMSREHLRLAESRPDELHAALAPLRALFVELLQAGIAAGEMRAGDADLRASLIYNLVSTTAHTELLAEEGEAPDHDRRRRLAAEVWEFCRRAIAV
jgi:AcrR family transcriptional regulator